MNASNIIELSSEQSAELAKITTVSAQIRYLHAQSFTRAQIAKKLDKRYQHVRNVLTTELKKK